VTHSRVSQPASDLYGLPLERFTDERNALARRLREQGRRDEAADVAKLRKPSVAAWAVNQLVRTQNRQIDALFDAGDALQKAQADVLAGKADSGSLRKAAEAERTALDSLIGKARGLLSGEGHELSPAKLEQVSETLHAAAIDERARVDVRDGCLTRELRHVGLGALDAAAVSKPRAKATRPPKDEERAARLKAARRAEVEARRELGSAKKSVQAAEYQRALAAQNLQEAEQALIQARDLLQQTTRDHKRARRALEELEG
jgi:hypothetical protein